MELQALRCFVTVAEELHFGRAAERLHLAQPAVSRRIALLERELGVQLFDRSPRRVRLTGAGHRVLGAARDALAAVEQVRVVAADSAGTMRIGTAAGFAVRLERGIEALHRDSNFEVALVDLPITARLNALRQGDIDMTLARGPVVAPGLRVLPAWREALMAVVSRRHPAADRPDVGADDLSRSALRMPPRRQDPFAHDAVSTALRDAGIDTPTGRPAGTPRDTIIEIGSDPGSWTVLPADQAREVTSPRIRAIPLRPPMTVTGNVILPPHLPSRCFGAHVAAFRDAPGS
ncbi:LysR family transcriptional regulator [Nocardia aurantia]|uniref:HTH-type transcriptional regulator HdfR n=1 Tax=Nocardia aurantia TaxID=2585199 RepID=A0A7K0DTW7_9NOCA|nr:LysR family transcriptional regulator [Nocardia aurantia]MQY29215.1 HTH-type transcriptional regulator HdfR [Nocardia aurantia]